MDGTAVLIAGKIAFAAVGLAVGVHLMRSARHEASLGLHTLASAAIFVGGLGLVLIPLGHGIGPGPAGWITAHAGELAMRIGMAILCVFVLRVFRPESAAAQAWAGTCIAALVASLAWDVSAQSQWWRYDDSLPSAYAAQLAIALPFAWSCFESGLHFQRSSRRLGLGLVDPLVPRRFLLWTLATASFSGVCLLAVVAGWARAAGQAELASFASGTRGLLYGAISYLVWAGIFSPGKAGARVASTS
jgi:hypothetical protein